MIVADFMTRAPQALPTGSTLKEAVECMDEHRIRHLPILEDGCLVGVVSDRDLLTHAGRDEGARWVEDIMQRDVVTVGPDDPVVAAAVEVSVRQIGCLPVVEEGKLVGIVSEVDLLRLVAETKTGSAAVGSLGVVQAISVASTAPLEQVDQLMTAKSVRHLPVVDGEKLVGMFTDRDLRRAQGQGLDKNDAIAGCMTREVVAVADSVPIHEAARSLADQRIGALVLTGEGGEIGIVTSTDLLEHALGVLGS